MDNKEQRCNEFLSCLGNGKTIYQVESQEQELCSKCKQQEVAYVLRINKVFRPVCQACYIQIKTKRLVRSRELKKHESQV